MRGAFVITIPPPPPG